jgi:hypothetical protein
LIEIVSSFAVSFYRWGRNARRPEHHLT